MARVGLELMKALRLLDEKACLRPLYTMKSLKSILALRDDKVDMSMTGLMRAFKCYTANYGKIYSYLSCEKFMETLNEGFAAFIGKTEITQELVDNADKKIADVLSKTPAERKVQSGTIQTVATALKQEAERKAAKPAKQKRYSSKSQRLLAMAEDGAKKADATPAGEHTQPASESYTPPPNNDGDENKNTFTNNLNCKSL